MFNVPSFVLGIILGFLLSTVLFASIGVPNQRAIGFAEGSCTVTCGWLTPSIEGDRCYCEEANKDRIFKEIPKYSK
jgi:hypothetical protein